MTERNNKDMFIFSNLYNSDREIEKTDDENRTLLTVRII